MIQVDGTPGTCSTAAAFYFYDTQGRRVQKVIGSGETSYLYDLSGHVVAEDYGSGWGPGYVCAGGQLIGEHKNSTTYFVHDNNIGTSTILTSVTGAVADCNALYPYGEQDNTICTTSTTTSHKFTGKERDTESNLDNFGARYYSSAQGRFLTADWSAIPAPVPYANLSDPQTLNLYAYVGNNPLGRVDPDGHAEPGGATPNDVQAGNVQTADISSSQTATGQDKKQSPDPKLPINKNYRMVVLSDSGKVVPQSDTREVNYALHTAPNAKDPMGKPVSSSNVVVTEHLSNSYFKSGQESGTGL